MVIKEWTDLDYARAALDLLPETPEDIARFLRVHGIHGRRPENGWTCPIAKWVHRWTDTEAILIGRYRFAINDAEYPLPRSVKDFIHMYDFEGLEV